LRVYQYPHLREPKIVIYKKKGRFGSGAEGVRECLLVTPEGWILDLRSHRVVLRKASGVLLDFIDNPLLI